MSHFIIIDGFRININLISFYQSFTSTAGSGFRSMISFSEDNFIYLTLTVEEIDKIIEESRK